MRRSIAASVAVAAGGAAAGAIAAGRAADRRRVSSDPERAFLREPPHGRAGTVPGAAGVELHVEEFGPAEAPPIVLVHGWSCQLRFWAYQLRDLAPAHRLIAYDLRGHGLSGIPPDGDLSTEALADDLEAVLDACLDAEEPAVLVGHSLGAMTIAAWAARHPEAVSRRARAVVMVNTGLGDLVDQALVLRLPGPLDFPRQHVSRLVMGVAGPLPARNPVSHRLMRHVVMGPTATPARVAFCENMVLDCPHHVRAGAGRTLSRLQLHDAVERITAPAFVVAGERDRMTPMPLSERLAEDLPELVSLVRIPDVGHMAPVEAPERVTAVIRDAAALGG